LIEWEEVRGEERGSGGFARGWVVNLANVQNRAALKLGDNNAGQLVEDCEGINVGIIRELIESARCEQFSSCGLW
jgi:hypothetical protein